MKDIISIRIPSICICFTLVTVANSALNLLHRGGTDMYAVSILLIFVWLVLCQLIDAAICRIDFKKWIHYCITESLILYLATLVFCRVFYWHSFTVRQLIMYTVVFAFVDIFIFSYFRKRQEMRADEINRLLNKKDAV